MHSINRIALITTLVFVSLFLGCKDNNPDPSVTAPRTYAFERDGVSTVSFDGQTTRIAMASELVSAMSDFDKTAIELIELYANQTVDGTDADPFSSADLNASTKSVKSKVAASSDLFSSNTVESAKIKAKIQSWIEDQVSFVYPNKDLLATQGQSGQIADGTSARYINEKGLEYNQAVNKSLIGALMIDQICNNYLSSAVLDAGDNRLNNDLGIVEDGNMFTSMEHKWDEAYGYLFGASTDPSDPLINLGEDIFLSKYLARVENDSDFTGIASEIFDAFKLGRAAIVSKDYNLRDQQAQILKAKLGEVIAIRAVHYLQAGKNDLEANNYGSAFHSLSEGLGFIYSLRFIRSTSGSESIFSESTIDGFIDLLLRNDGFWTVESNTLDDISNVIADKFDFTLEQTIN